MPVVIGKTGLTGKDLAQNKILFCVRYQP